MPTRLRTTLASIWTWTLLSMALVVTLPCVLLYRAVAWPWDRWNYRGGRWFRNIGPFVAFITPRWRFETRGVRPADPRHPYVVVSNHESFADMLLLTHLPWEMKWLSKVEIFRIPFLGWLLWAAMDIGVKRGRGTSAKDAMNECKRRLRDRVSVMIFPEGTRSPEAEMLPFKDGAFRLAVEAGVPILPLALYGTRSAIAKHDWRIGTTHAIVEVLSPEPTDGLTLADVPALRERVRERILAARDRLRDELAREPQPPR
jgi:1-acyl-sn-glycerol-3-phosphate acyltransferase